MDLLTKEQEETLQRIIEQSNANIKKAGRVDINCTADGFERSIIDYLIHIGFLRNVLKENNFGLYGVSPTEQGKNYFRKKEDFLETQKLNKIKAEKIEKKEDRKFWISIGISIGAFIIATLTLILQYTVG